MPLNTSFTAGLPPSVPAVSFPSRNPAGVVSVIVYVPGRRLPNVNVPSGCVVSGRFTETPRSSVPVRTTVAPGMPLSPESTPPLLFRSSKTMPLNEPGASSPKLLPEPSTPCVSAMAEIVLLSARLLIVPLPCEPTVSCPSRNPAGCVSVIV